MASTLPIMTPRYEYDVANRIHLALLKQFDETFAFSDKVLRRTDPTSVQLMSSAIWRLYLAFKDLKPFIRDQSVSDTEIRIRGIADALGEIRYEEMAICVHQNHPQQLPVNRKLVP